MKNTMLNNSYKVFWGEIHTHTSFSDGKRTPEEQVVIARTHLDFWAVADHAINLVPDSSGTPFQEICLRNG